MKPEFIGIGGQRCGSTLLFNILKTHPSFKLPYFKELHYFDRERGRGYLNNNHRKKIGRWEEVLRDWKLNQISKEEVKWYLKYITFPRSDNWYKSLFKEKFIAGEITPAYSTFPIEYIQEMREIIGETKIIIVIRDPIDRVKSQLKNLLKKGRLNGQSYNTFQKAVKDNGLKKRSFLSQSYLNYTSVFGKENVFVSFADELYTNQKREIDRLGEFFNVSKSQFHLINQKVNKSSDLIFDKKTNELILK